MHIRTSSLKWRSLEHRGNFCLSRLLSFLSLLQAQPQEYLESYFQQYYLLLENVGLYLYGLLAIAADSLSCV